MTLPLKGFSALVTAGPTYEPIDPVRFIGNRSSGKQGFAVAEALAVAGADVTLVAGPVGLGDPDGVRVVRVETAKQMLAACLEQLPVDIAVFAAAVGDWAPVFRDQKVKKQGGAPPPSLVLEENPDILTTVSTHAERPQLVVGFAAETENLIENAAEKRARKSCDWILANDVSQNVFGADENHVYLISETQQKEFERASKHDIARSLVLEIEEYFKNAG